MQTFQSSSSSRPPDPAARCRASSLPALRAASGSPGAGQHSPRSPAHTSAPGPPRARGRQLPEPMAEAGRSSPESPGEPVGQVAAEAPEPKAPALPPALRRLPGDPSPRGRSQSDLSSCSSRGRPLRVHISGSGKGHSGYSGSARGGRGQVAATATRPAWGVLGHWPRRLAEGEKGEGKAELLPPARATAPPRLPRLPAAWLLGRRCSSPPAAGAPRWARASPGRSRVQPWAVESAPTAVRRRVHQSADCQAWPSGRGTFLRATWVPRKGAVLSGSWAEAGLGNPPNCSCF